MDLLDVVVAVANAPVTVLAAAVNAATGARVRLDRHLTVVCEGGLLSDLGLSSAFTTGNTVNVKRSAVEYFNTYPEILDHEWRHSLQWAALGLAFLPLYAVNYALSARLTGGQCWNVFEWHAGFADGHYPCGDALAENSSTS
ncbi:MAG TPA: hypothetical protein VHC63_15050 [Acidimicrobiales bacterium]|nr:hypothetical protein [Acidimicrobiales bacterium]